jgi:hypothetical protein
MGRTTYRQIRKALKHFSEPRPKSFSKTLIRMESKTTIFMMFKNTQNKVGSLLMLGGS